MATSCTDANTSLPSDSQCKNSLEPGEKGGDGTIGTAESTEPSPERNQETLLTSEEEKGWNCLFQSMMEHDNQQIEKWKSELDNLLVFAGLFSAVVTAFSIESSHTLQPDPSSLSDRSNVLLERISSQLESISLNTTVPLSPLQPPQPFRPDPANLTINRLWFLSLTLSILASFFAIAAQQWVRNLALPPHLGLRDAVRRRQQRHDAAIDFQLPFIIDFLPVILQIAVVLFLIGLHLFLRQLDVTLMVTTAVVAGIPFVLYILSLAFPFFFPSCPYKSPVLPAFLSLAKWGQTLLKLVAGTTCFLAYLAFCIGLGVGLAAIFIAPILASYGVLIAMLLAMLALCAPIIIPVIVIKCLAALYPGFRTGLIQRPSPESAQSDSSSDMSRMFAFPSGFGLLYMDTLGANLVSGVILLTRRFFAWLVASPWSSFKKFPNLWDERESRYMPQGAQAVGSCDAQALHWARGSLSREFHKLLPCVRGLPCHIQCTFISEWAVASIPSYHASDGIHGTIGIEELEMIDQAFVHQFGHLLLNALPKNWRECTWSEQYRGVAVALLLLSQISKVDEKFKAETISALCEACNSQNLTMLADNEGARLPALCLFHYSDQTGDGFAPRVTSLMALAQSHLSTFATTDFEGISVIVVKRLRQTILSLVAVAVRATKQAPQPAGVVEGLLRALQDFFDSGSHPYPYSVDALVDRPPAGFHDMPSAVYAIAEFLRALAQTNDAPDSQKDLCKAIGRELYGMCGGSDYNNARGVLDDFTSPPPDPPSESIWQRSMTFLALRTHPSLQGSMHV